MKSKKKNLYKEYLRQKEIEQEKERISKEHNIDKDNIIIGKNRVGKIQLYSRFLGNIFTKLAKIFLYISIFMLITIGATVLMNESLRAEIFSLFNQNLML